MREQETRQALDDAEIKSLELEGQKRLFQQVGRQFVFSFHF